MKNQLENIEQYLMENLAELLGGSHIKDLEQFAGIQHKEPREKRELHIRMAKAAMEEYKRSVLDSPPLLPVFEAEIMGSNDKIRGFAYAIRHYVPPGTYNGTLDYCLIVDHKTMPDGKYGTWAVKPETLKRVF